LCDAVCAAGHQAEIVTLPFQSCPPSRIPEQMLACRLLDVTETCSVRIDRVIGLKFPAYLVPHPHKVIWLLHQHRTAYELWNHPAAGDLIHYPDGPVVRDAIRLADSVPSCRKPGHYTLSKNVSERLQRYSGIDSEPLYNPPAHAPLFHKGPARDYFFFPSRINPVKRQWLVIQALALCREPVQRTLRGRSRQRGATSRMCEGRARAPAERSGRVAGTMVSEERKRD
jgi:glycosyltransferase involved in cell wall biosynthesis